MRLPFSHKEWKEFLATLPALIILLLIVMLFIRFVIVFIFHLASG
jgi:hypothetical protein